MTADISKICKDSQVKLDILEIRKPELDAQLVAEQIAVQLERRISFRRAMKRSLQTAMEFGAEGIRVRCAGRLGGADIARSESYREGKVPLQTLRVPLDYGFAEARTVYGIIGVKCWVNKMDEDGGGSLSRLEFSRGLRMLGVQVTAYELLDLVDLLDEDGSGFIELEEMVSFWESC